MTDYTHDGIRADKAIHPRADRDRNEPTARDDLAELLVGYPLPPPGSVAADSLRSNAFSRADAIIAAGWVHWPHDCDTEAELIAQWAHTSFETMAELHRLTAENTALRRRLVEAGALDPSESVGE